MILTFCKSEFVDKIKSGVKKHTIRKDLHNRWTVGKKIHFWLHNPRNLKLNPRCFGVGKVVLVRRIQINLIMDDVLITAKDYNPIYLSTGKGLDEFARSDGFESWEEMKEFFIKKYKNYFFSGRIIYFNYEGENETTVNN